jgi:hypothetical protein
MTAIGRAIDTVIRDGLAPPLTASGFRRHRRIFRRTIDDAVHVVEVQGNKWNMGAHGQITLNLGVYFRAVAALDPEEGPPTESPTAGACLLRRRISRLMPVAEDHWWSIDEQTDLRELGDELAATWIAYGEPWFGSVPDLATAAAQLERDGTRYLAATACLALGDRDAAARLLHAAIAHAPQWAERYRAWGRQHGLMLTPAEAARSGIP